MDRWKCWTNLRRSCLPPKHTWFATRAYLRPPPNGDPGSCLNRRQSNHRRSPIRPLPLRPQPPGQIPLLHPLKRRMAWHHSVRASRAWPELYLAEMMKRVFEIEVLECPRCPGAYANRGCYSSSGCHSENSGLSRAALAGAAGSSCILQILGPTGMVLRRPKSRCRIGVPSACAIST